MTERTNDPEHESPEDEGIRDTGRPHPKKIPTGDPQDEWTARRDAGRLREEGSGLTDHEKDEVATEESDDLEGRSAEEAAVRVEDEPEGLAGGPDRYIEGDKETG
jgi:hypothetical protein